MNFRTPPSCQDCVFMAGMHRASQWLALLMLVIAPVQVPARSTFQISTTPGQNTFNDQAAAKLLQQFTDGLQSRNASKALGVFDLVKMPGGQFFRQQIISFIAHTESIRIHLNLVKTSAEDGKGLAEVEVEMETSPREGNSPPVHQQDRLHFSAENDPKGWKFSDVQPRAFFAP